MYKKNAFILEAKQIQTDIAGLGVAGAVTPTSEASCDAAAWPELLPQRISAVRDFLNARVDAVGVAEVRRAFKRAPAKDFEAALETLASLGLIVRYDAAGGRRRKAAAR